MRERDVSRYLNERVRELGGEIRRVSWLGRRNAPDKLVLLPGAHGWAEEKRPGKDAEAAQAREHKRMREAGMFVRVVSTEDEADRFLRILSQRALQARAE